MIRSPKTEAEWKEYYNLRYKVLRAPLNQPLGSERNEKDSEGFHLAYFVKSKIVAIAKLDSINKEVAQARFVAVAIKNQGKGYGKTIMQEVERKAVENGKTKLILHARDYAVQFYLNLNYSTIEKSYKLYDVLQHYLMEKSLI